MNKPTQKVFVEGLSYHECAKYIAEKLGVKSLNDFAGKYVGARTGGNINDLPMQDFWHVVIDLNDDQVMNGCWISLETNGVMMPDWSEPIIEAFAFEFGSETEYWAEW